MPTLKLNPIQRYRLYQFMEKQGKGITHLRRLQRIHEGFKIGPIEDTFEKNQETIAEFSAEGKAVPKKLLQVFKVEDPAEDCSIEEGDLGKIYDRLQLLKKDMDADGVKGVDEVQEWRIWLPVFDGVDAAYEKIKEKKETSKSVEEKAT